MNSKTCGSSRSQVDLMTKSKRFSELFLLYQTNRCTQVGNFQIELNSYVARVLNNGIKSPLSMALKLNLSLYNSNIFFKRDVLIGLQTTDNLLFERYESAVARTYILYLYTDFAND